MVEKQVLHYYFDQAKEMFKSQNLDKARDYLDMMLVYVARKREDGYSPEEELEGVKITLWIDRAWQHLEKWNLML